MKRICAVLALDVPGMARPSVELNRLVQDFPTVDFLYTHFNPNGLEKSAQAEVLYSYTITPTILKDAINLKWFHSVVTGPDAYTFPELVDSGVTVTSPRGVHSIPIAETAVGMMLALTRKIQSAIVSQERSLWGASEIYHARVPADELEGRNAMIIGMGGIGNALGIRLRSLGMEITSVVREKCAPPEFTSRQIIFDDFRKELGSADFVILTCPLTSLTRGMIGKDELSLMKRTAYLINVARGELVSESDLIAALSDGTIAGAASDVFSVEPLPEKHPFYKLPNMIVTPHVSGWSNRFWERSFKRFAENLTLYIEKKPLIGTVDFERGY